MGLSPSFANLARPAHACTYTLVVPVASDSGWPARGYARGYSLSSPHRSARPSSPEEAPLYGFADLLGVYGRSAALDATGERPREVRRTTAAWYTSLRVS